MAELALKIHSTEPTGIDLPDNISKAYMWVNDGVALMDRDAAAAITKP